MIISARRALLPDDLDAAVHLALVLLAETIVPSNFSLSVFVFMDERPMCQ